MPPHFFSMFKRKSSNVSSNQERSEQSSDGIRPTEFLEVEESAINNGASTSNLTDEVERDGYVLPNSARQRVTNSAALKPIRKAPDIPKNAQKAETVSSGVAAYSVFDLPMHKEKRYDCPSAPPPKPPRTFAHNKNTPNATFRSEDKKKLIQARRTNMEEELKLIDDHELKSTESSVEGPPTEAETLDTVKQWFSDCRSGFPASRMNMDSEDAALPQTSSNHRQAESNPPSTVGQNKLDIAYIPQPHVPSYDSNLNPSNKSPRVVENDAYLKLKQSPNVPNSGFNLNGTPPPQIVVNGLETKFNPLPRVVENQAYIKTKPIQSLRIVENDAYLKLKNTSDAPKNVPSFKSTPFSDQSSKNSLSLETILPPPKSSNNDLAFEPILRRRIPTKNVGFKPVPFPRDPKSSLNSKPIPPVRFQSIAPPLPPRDDPYFKPSLPQKIILGPRPIPPPLPPKRNPNFKPIPPPLPPKTIAASKSKTTPPHDPEAQQISQKPEKIEVSPHDESVDLERANLETVQILDKVQQPMEQVTSNTQTPPQTDSLDPELVINATDSRETAEDNGESHEMMVYPTTPLSSIEPASSSEKKTRPIAYVTPTVRYPQKNCLVDRSVGTEEDFPIVMIDGRPSFYLRRNHWGKNRENVFRRT